MKDFYSATPINAIDNHEYTFAVVLNKKHRVYDGHFPQHPVVPGVCMILMIRELVEKAVGGNLMFAGISNIKFLSLVDPAMNHELSIRLTIDPIEADGYNIKASIEFAGKVFLSLKGSLSAIITCADASAIDNERLEN